MKSGCDVAKLVDLMMKGQASAQVAAQTCDLIKRHVLPKKSSELPAAVTASSCMQAVLCAMDAHLSSPEVQEQAVWCLKNLALNRPENEETLMTLGGAEAILMAMTENCSNEAVQKEGCVAVAKLTTKHQNVLKFLSLGAGEAVLDALRNYTTSTGVQWWAFQALGNLAESREGRAKLRDLLAADVINAAMSSGNSEIQEKGQQLLEKSGQVGHTGPWDVTLSCCAEASPVCKDRRGFGRGWVRWWFCVLAFISFMLTEPWRNSLLLEWTGPTFIEGGGQFFGTASAAWCSICQPQYGGIIRHNGCAAASLKPMEQRTTGNYHNWPTEILVFTPCAQAESAHFCWVNPARKPPGPAAPNGEAAGVELPWCWNLLELRLAQIHRAKTVLSPQNVHWQFSYTPMSGGIIFQEYINIIVIFI